MPRPRPLAGRVALVTGGGGGIGAAITQWYLPEGACVLLADISGDALSAAAEALRSAHSADVVRTMRQDVTDEEAVANAFARAAREYGGIAILVSNTGITSSARVEETTLAS